MSDDSPVLEILTNTPTSETTSPAGTSKPTLDIASPSGSLSKTQSAIRSLSSILPTTTPPDLCTALSLLHDHEVASNISFLLRQPNSGAGDDNLCRWLYDTFQSGEPDLQLVVLRFLPIIAGLYLSRVSLSKPLAGFEAVLLALYAHETTSRAGQPITVNVPDLSHPSVYHESVSPTKNNSTAFNLAVLSPSLEPLGTVRSTKRARIVGVALELYYNKIFQMPIGSKIDFCDFCVVWAGHEADVGKDSDYGASELLGANESRERMGREGRIPLPWELLQPVLRILGHCLLGTRENKELFDAAWAACRSLSARSIHDIDPRAILATGSLLRLGKMAMEPKDDYDPTEVQTSGVITI
ncbi:hypothetical protein I3760_13G126600 [Carya illinoinensis]|nr:hypothetical protein I3760_13G126600 [Carya illinoinensis]